MAFIHDKPAYTYSDVVLKPQYSEIFSRSTISLATTISPDTTLKLPFIAANMVDVTNAETAILMARFGGMAVLPRFNSIEEQATEVEKIVTAGHLAWASIGIKDDYITRAKTLVETGVHGLVMDVAHIDTLDGHTAIRSIRKLFPGIPLIAGNIATRNAAIRCFDSGANTVKIGVGPGSICSTREMTGHGYPQLSAIMEIAEGISTYYSRFPKYLIADGGIVHPGDIVKALAAGSHAVMMGKMFAGANESPAKWTNKNGKAVKEYNGSTTIKDNYVEGVKAYTEPTGNILDIMKMLTEAVQSGLSYSGARNIRELQEIAEFVPVTLNGYKEGLPHDVLTG